ncbi:MAG: hypothetical protein H0W66_02440 [Chthoniobacterales bacterium]|nr:hypothetical protein [Chthoniobacterales bacterium]
MHLRKLTAVVLLVLSSFVAYGVNSTKPELEAMYDKAFNAFDEARYDDALKALDAIDVAQPDLAESLNLRGVVYMAPKQIRQGRSAPAQGVFAGTEVLERELQPGRDPVPQEGLGRGPQPVHRHDGGRRGKGCSPRRGS